MFRTFRSRLVLSNLLITLLGLFAIAVVFTQLLGQRSTDMKRSDRQTETLSLARQFEHLYSRHASIAQLAQTVDMASNILQARVILVSPSGTFIFDSARQTPWYTGSWHLLDREALARVHRAQKAVTGSSALVRFQAPIRGSPRHPDGGAVLLVAPVGDVTPDPAALRRILLILAGTALLVWILIGVYFTVSISRPLLRITEATGRMARGDYRVRVPAAGEGEIGRLAQSFNVMAQQVQAGNQVLRDFVANVSHDLRTPLTLIAGFSQALLDGTAGADEVESSAAIIHEESLKMQRMVDDLLQLTRLESGLLKLQPEPVPVGSFVQGTIDRVERAFHDRPHAALRFSGDGRLYFRADRVQMERALRNLVENALQYTPADGEVVVSAERRPHWVQIAVQDTGMGIPAEELPRVWERFYRTDRARERQGGHSGLGLAIVREIVEAHGGTVTAESEQGKGTTFRFTVPATAAPPSSERPAEGLPEGVVSR